MPPGRSRAGSSRFTTPRRCSRSCSRATSRAAPQTRRAFAGLELRAAGLEEEIARRRKLELESERQRRESERLFLLSAAVNRAVELDAIYEPALDALCELCDVDRAAILLFDADGVMRFK